MRAVRLSRRALELIERIAAALEEPGPEAGDHGAPGDDGLMEIWMRRETADYLEALRAPGEPLHEAVERTLERILGVHN